MIEGQEGVTWEQWLALAHACEGHGVGTLCRSDHYLSFSAPDRAGPLRPRAPIAPPPAPPRAPRPRRPRPPATRPAPAPPADRRRLRQGRHAPSCRALGRRVQHAVREPGRAPRPPCALRADPARRGPRPLVDAVLADDRASGRRNARSST